MAFVTASENTIQIVWWIGLAINICVGLMMLQVLAFQGIVFYRERKRQRAMKFWQPILLESVVSVPLQISRLKRSDAYEFLTLWNNLHESLYDNQVEKLNETARTAGADIAARRFLKKGSVRKRLMAVRMLGNLRDKESWNALEELLSQVDATLSFTAAQALLQIDAEKAVKIVMPLVASRTDWTHEAVSLMFKKVGADVISLPLSKAVIAACRKNCPAQETDTLVQQVPPSRLIHLMRFSHPRFVTYVVRYILLTMTDMETIAAALKVSDDPAILPAVRQFLSDERWQIRVNAANTIGRTGVAQDEQLLISALHDKEWWVRYRSAQALASLPSVDLEKLENIAAAQTDNFGRDILRQVMAERRLV